MKMRYGLALLLLLFGAVRLAETQSARTKFEDFNAAPEERAADLVSRMTLEEKVSQMQNTAPSMPRLGVPAYDWWNEALHGVARSGIATVFPQAIGLAAMWDTELHYRIADVISTEARGKYNDAIAHDNHHRYYGLTFWSPNINIFRDPRWGRGQETYGEDPYLTSRLGIAFIKGMQGNDPHYFKTIATSKHYAVHSGPEITRHKVNVDATPEDLTNTYLYAFHATLTEGAAYSVMCAYNRVNGAPACASTFLLQDTLRQAWKFPGYVVSDCDAVEDIYAGHHYTDSLAAASAKAVKAGTDLDCGKAYESLVEAVHKGLISEAEIDRAVVRLFVARIRLGMFDPPDRVPFSKIGLDQVASTAHQRLALEAAEKSIVLLKNENNVLPLARRARKIAVLGPAADDPDAMLGNYNGTPTHIVTPLQGIETEFGKRGKVQFALGSTYVESGTALIPKSVVVPAVFDGDGSPGLYATYRTPTDVFTRVEPHGYFVPGMHDPELPPNSSFVGWIAWLNAPATGDYGLGFTWPYCEECRGTSSAQLVIDDRQVAEANYRFRAKQPVLATVHLTEGPHMLKVEYQQSGAAPGLELVWRPPAEALLRQAIETVKGSDVAIVCIGLNAKLEGEESPIEIPGFDHGDRTDIRLPAPEEKLLESVLATGKPVVVVLVNGSALAVETAKNRAAAILEAWYGGQEGGTAIAETLSGKNNPGGRLPITFYKSVDQLPPFADYSMKNRTYRYFTGEPLYPFGYGLSYSTFAYSDQAVTGHAASVRVTNTSRREGDEVVQLFIKTDYAPNPVLKGFQRIHLRPHESRVVSFTSDDIGDRASVFIGNAARR
jgi:beta-glucosidase